MLAFIDNKACGISCLKYINKKQEKLKECL